MEKRQLLAQDIYLLKNYVGPQLANQTSIPLAFNHLDYLVDYRILEDKDHAIFKKKCIVLVPSFGFGLKGMSRLGYHLAKLGHLVLLVSPLGYGNSDNPPSDQNPDFMFQAEALRMFAASQGLSNQKLTWVAHSGAAPIISALAFLYPNMVSNLIYLNPAGFEKRSRIDLAIRCCLNGYLHAKYFKGDELWGELNKFNRVERSPFTPDRINQRHIEFSEIVSGKAFEWHKQIPEQIKLLYITGERDFVYRYEKSAVLQHWCKNKSCRTCYISVLNDQWHNTTMFGSEITALEIDGFVNYPRE